MARDMGEHVVGAYLKLEQGCDFVEYNVRPPTLGKDGQAEFDVVGFDFKSSTVCLCEVATHLNGLNYGGNSNSDTLKRITDKYRRQRNYAERNLSRFANVRFMFWSPYVPRGYLTRNLDEIEGLELVINGRYRECVELLRARAKAETRDSNEPFFRALQILEHMKPWS